FLWLCVKRTKYLPDGGEVETVNFAPHVQRLREVICRAKEIRQMHRDAAARAAWHAVYPTLSDERPGLVGAILGRAEAQVLRLSMLYALLDGTDTIQPAHLYAALAVWEYAEASVTYIFGHATGDPVAETLLAAVENASPQGLTTKQILEDVFQRNRRADEITRAMRTLLDGHRISVETYHPPKGRPGTIVKAIPYEQNELNEQKPGGYLNFAKNSVLRHGHSAGDSTRVNEQNAVDSATEGIRSFTRQQEDNATSPATVRDSRLSSLSSLSSYCPHEQRCQEGGQVMCC